MGLQAEIECGDLLSRDAMKPFLDDLEVIERRQDSKLKGVRENFTQEGINERVIRQEKLNTIKEILQKINFYVDKVGTKS